MPEELDPTTARLVSELAAQILPALTKSLTSAIPSADFFEKNKQTSQELSLNIEKVKSAIDENKSERNIIVQSIGNMVEEFAELKNSLTSRSPLEKAIQSEIDDSRAGRNIIVQSIGNMVEEFAELKHSITSYSPIDKAMQSGIDDNREGQSIIVQSIGNMVEEFADLKRSITSRSTLEKAIKSGIDDSRAGRSIIVQSIGNVLEELSGLKRTLDKLPGNLELLIKSNKPEANNNDKGSEEVLSELAGLSAKIEDLTNGIKYFCETYANSNEARNYEPHDMPLLTNEAQLEKIVNISLPNLEGLVKAESKSHHHELEEFSREIAALHEQNNIAMVQEVKDAVVQELTKHYEKKFNDEKAKEDSKKILRLLKVTMLMSGVGIFLLLIAILTLIIK